MHSRIGSRRATSRSPGTADASAPAEASARPDLRILPRSVQQQTVETLRSAILSGMFQPGDRLIEMDLCERLGISRPSLREALRSLEAERLVVIIPNRGPQIPILAPHEAAEIYQVRALLEGEAAALCATRSTRDDHREMRAALTRFGRAARSEDAAARLASTADFYRVILRTCGNRLIEEMLQGLNARISLLRLRSMSFPGRAKLSLEEMRAMLKAIEAQDSVRARAAAIRHVEQAQLFARAADEAQDASPRLADRERA